MRTSLQYSLLMISVMSIAPCISGQSGVSDFDSVIFIKPRPSIDLYNFFDNGDKEIQLWGNKPELMQNRKNPGLRDAGNGVLTAITGIGLNVRTELTWKFEGTIKCNDSLPDWRIILLCDGYQEKTRERVKNDEGSWSVYTQVDDVHFWNLNAIGIILEGTDTIGFFVINMDPRKDTLLKPWSADVFLKKDAPQNFSSKNKWANPGMPETHIDYSITGILRSKNFTLIRNGRDKQAWIYIETVLISKFQPDRKYQLSGKKSPVLSYLLLDKNIVPADKCDMARLAVMNRFLNNTITIH
jgi:hypothetical protein